MSDAKQTASQRMHSALIIGLGGTGKQVLLNLRRMFYERHGRVSPPYVGNLWIDTDTRNVTLDGKEMDFLMREVDFEENEKVSIELLPAELANYYDHPDAFPHVFSWFDQRLKKHGHIRDGAGQIRSFGRLAFFSHYNPIISRLREKRTEIQRAVAYNEASKDFNVNLAGGDLDVWLVFSVAGGTGGGMFLDMVFAMRHLWSNVRMRGIIVLPSVFSNDLSARIYGNAYASFMELEHYNYGKDEGDTDRGGDLHRYPIAWTREMYQQGPRTLPGPVFDTAYVIGNQPASHSGSLALEDKDALCRMLAEWLFIEYATGREVESLAAERRSSEANFVNALNGVTSFNYAFDGLSFREIFSRRYSSFGLSKIYIPIHRIEAVIHHQLAKDFIEMWTKEKPIPANLDELLDREFLNRVGIDNSKRYDSFRRALDSESTSGGRLTQRLQRLIWQDKRNQLIARASDESISGRINKWVEEDLIVGQLDINNAVKDRWGLISKQILQNTDAHYRKVIDGLHELVADLLDQPNYRFAVTREVLRRMRDRLIKDKERFEKVRDKSRADSNSLIQETQERLTWLNDVKNGFTRRTIIEVALERIEARVARELQAQIAANATQLAERIVDYIGRGKREKRPTGEEVVLESGLIKQLAEFEQRLQGEVSARLDERLQAFQKIEPSPIYQDMGEGLQEVDRFYIDQNSQPIVERTLVEWERRFFEEQASDGPGNLWAVRRKLGEEGAKKFIDRLLTFARINMRYLEHKTVNVIERLRERYKPESPQYATVIERLLGYGQPWLAEPEHFIDRQNTLPEVVQDNWIAEYDQTGMESYDQFSARLRKMSTTRLKQVNTSPDRVYAVSEVAGFPLMLIPDLDRYRNESYRSKLEAGEVLHTDLAFEKFQDLLIMEQDEVKSYVHALRIFLQALLLNIIRCEKVGISHTGAILKYRFINREGLFEKPVDLGPFSVAVRRLARPAEQELVDLIERDLSGQLNRQDVETLARWYALLYFHADSPKSYFHQFPRDHVVRSMFREIAAQVLQQSPGLENQAKTEITNMEQWAAQRPPATGLYVLDQEPL